MMSTGISKCRTALAVFFKNISEVVENRKVILLSMKKSGIWNEKISPRPPQLYAL